MFEVPISGSFHPEPHACREYARREMEIRPNKANKPTPSMAYVEGSGIDAANAKPADSPVYDANVSTVIASIGGRMEVSYI